MRITTKQRLAAVFTAGLVTVVGATLGLATGSALAQSDRSQKSEKTASNGKDTIILKDGRVLEGKILKEDDKKIEFQLVMTSGLTAERTIDRSEILEIKRAADATKPEGDSKTGTKPANPAGGTTTKPATPSAAGAGTKVYMVPLTGSFQRDVSLTSMKRVMEDAKKVQPDIIVISINCDYKTPQGSDRPEWWQDMGAYDQLELARQIDPILTDAVREDPDWKVKPRLVFWVRKALGGVAFLPFLSPEIYYTSDAKHGGIGYLDYIFEGVGDDFVREKQRSLRLGRAQGLAIKGGHKVEILNAMSRVDYVLSVNFVGGRPEFREDTLGEVLLTDDGDPRAGNRDSTDDVLRFTGNDVLTLTSDMAARLGMSSGTVDTEDQLFDKLGISRSNPVKVGKAGAILEEWSRAVTESEFSIRRLMRDLERVEVRPPGGWNERTEARGKQKRILKDILAYLEKYKEEINPYEIQAYPPNLITELKLTIDGIEQAQRRDKDK